MIFFYQEKQIQQNKAGYSKQETTPAMDILQFVPTYILTHRIYKTTHI